MSVRNKRIDDLVTRKEAEKIRWDHVLKLCDPPQVPSELLIESVRQRTVFSVCELVADPSSSVTHTHTHTHARACTHTHTHTHTHVRTHAHITPQAQVLTKAHYDSVVEDRSIGLRCGYPLCSRPLPKGPKPKFKVAANKGQVLDIEEAQVRLFF